MVTDPLEELEKNIDLISPVKRCPKCGKLSIEFDVQTNRIFCTSCGYEVYMKK